MTKRKPKPTRHERQFIAMMLWLMTIEERTQIVAWLNGELGHEER